MVFQCSPDGQRDIADQYQDPAVERMDLQRHLPTAIKKAGESEMLVVGRFPQMLRQPPDLVLSGPKESPASKRPQPAPVN